MLFIYMLYIYIILYIIPQFLRCGWRIQSNLGVLCQVLAPKTEVFSPFERCWDAESASTTAPPCGAPLMPWRFTTSHSSSAAVQDLGMDSFKLPMRRVLPFQDLKPEASTFNDNSMTIQWRFNGDSMAIQWQFNGHQIVT